MITEETKLERERKFEKINRYFIPAYLLLGVGAAIVNAFRKDVYHFSIGLGTLLIPLALTLFYKIFHLKRVHQVDFWVVLFSLVGYTCGSVLEFYLMIPNFDKVVHTLSGVLVSMLAYALFRAVKPGHAVEKKDRALAMLFVFFASGAELFSSSPTNLQNPPKGIARSENCVPLCFQPRIFGPNPTENSTTPMPQSRPTIKCPNSWQTIITPKITIASRI